MRNNYCIYEVLYVQVNKDIMQMLMIVIICCINI